MYCNFAEFITLLCTFLVIFFFFFARYREYMICFISFNKFLNVLPACTYAKAISNIWIICLEVNILTLDWSHNFSEKPIPSISIGNILLWKAPEPFSLSLKNVYKFFKRSSLFYFFVRFSCFICILKFQLINHFDFDQFLLR